MKVSEILKISKEKMQGKWQLAFIVTAVVAAVVMIVPRTLTPALGGLEGIANITWMFAVSLPVGTGAAWLFLDLVDGNEGDINNIFDVFLDLRRIIRAWTLHMLRVVAQLLLFVIPGLIAMINYSQMDFILKDNPEMDGSEALRLSKKMMRGNRMRYLHLYVRIFWPTILMMTIGLSMIMNAIITAEIFGGEMWIDPVLLSRANGMMILSSLGAHVFNTYARPTFAVFYRDLKPLEASE